MSVEIKRNLNKWMISTTCDFKICKTFLCSWNSFKFEYVRKSLTLKSFHIPNVKQLIALGEQTSKVICHFLKWFLHATKYGNLFPEAEAYYQCSLENVLCQESNATVYYFVSSSVLAPPALISFTFSYRERHCQSKAL